MVASSSNFFGASQGNNMILTSHRYRRFVTITRVATGVVTTLCTALTPNTSYAQSAEVPVAPAVNVRRVAPGDTSLRFTALASDTTLYFLNAYRGVEEISIGTITDVLTRTTDKMPMLRRVLIVERGTTRLTDSTLSDAQTLSPKRRYSWQPQRVLQLEFTGQQVKGMLGPPDAPGVPLDTTLMVPAFDAGNWDLVVRAMPLAPDYQATFPVFDIETGTHLYGVRVIGSTTMMGEAAHIVMFQLGGTREVKVWIGVTTRRLLQIETPIDANISLMQTLRQPPS